MSKQIIQIFVTYHNRSHFKYINKLTKLLSILKDYLKRIIRRPIAD